MSEELLKQNIEKAQLEIGRKKDIVEDEYQNNHSNNMLAGNMQN